jgi:hypothetical protein
MLVIQKRNKNPKKRRLVIYDNDKVLVYIDRCWGWYSFSKRLDLDLHNQCRALIMENLYWLLGNDCDFDEWNDSIEKWDKGKMYNVPVTELPSSLFFDGEKEIALNSFYK